MKNLFVIVEKDDTYLTYLKTLVRRNSGIRIFVIFLGFREKELLTNEGWFIRQWFFPDISSEKSTYYRNVVTILKFRIKEMNKLHFYLCEPNEILAGYLSEFLDCRIIERTDVALLLNQLKLPPETSDTPENKNISFNTNEQNISYSTCVPKIIHQVWEGSSEPFPEFYRQIAERWKKFHPDWQYCMWSRKEMESFLNDYFPDFSDVYHTYRYNVQRWDAIRYLILYKIGGLYVDSDYDCLYPIDDLMSETGKCYFAVEPLEHCVPRMFINNALMGSPPGHPFFRHIIDHLIASPIQYTENKMRDILTSTGPHMITSLYEKYPDKSLVGLLPAEMVSPWSKQDVINFKNEAANHVLLEKKLKKTVAIHYFWGSWT